MKKENLNGLWLGQCISEAETFCFDATVPGCSIQDLINCGKLPKDIFYRDNSAKARDFENCDYTYQREFTYNPGENCRQFLRFERLDTYCKIYLNGELLAETANGFIPHEFDVTGKLKSGVNHLSLQFTSPITAVKDFEFCPGAFTKERMNIRRTQCTFGWDWVDRFVSVGICGDVTLREEAPDEILIDSAYIYTKSIDEDSALVGIDLSFRENSAPGLLRLQILDPSGKECRHLSRYCKESFFRFSVDIPKAQLWYPNGYGEQPIYTLLVTDEAGHELWNEPFGIRTVKIMQLPDAEGSEYYNKCLKIKHHLYDHNEEFSGFILKVNGVKVPCLGGNWVPSEPFYNGSTDEKITRALELAKEAGVTMLRVWGGGAFETEHFYDECSRLGIMVTQDFLMACGKYPEHQAWFIEELHKEATYAAKLMRNKTCLMWWSGDNENAVMGNDVQEDYKGRASAFRGIAPVLWQMDPYREFLPSSPYGGDVYCSNTVGTTHVTAYLDSHIFPYILNGECDDPRGFYKQLRARFIAEEPQLGAVSPTSLQKIMTDEDIYGDSLEMWYWHTKSNPAVSTPLFDFCLTFAEKLLGKFTSPEDRYFKCRYLQYEWLRMAMEQMRREMWFCAGMIFWMWNDCWPASSGWALLDYYNLPKDAFYAFKRCAGQVVLSLDKEDDAFVLYASNLKAAKPAQITFYGVKDKALRKLETASVTLPEAGSAAVCKLNAQLEDGEVLVADVTAEGIFDRTFWVPNKPLLEETTVQYTVDEKNRTVTVTAEGYVHVVELEADAVFTDNCFNLLPGETRTVGYTPNSDAPITCTAYTLA